MDPSHSLDDIARCTAQTDGFKQVVSSLRSGEKRILLHGLPPTLLAFLITQVQRSISAPILAIAADEDQAEQWRDDLQQIAGEEIVRYFPAWDVELYEGRSPDIEITELRVEAAARLQQKKPTIVVGPASALLTPLIPPHALDLATLHLRTGVQHSLDELSAHLADSGFEQVSIIDGVGQFSVRGGILDIYPFGTEHPLRLEFFDDEVESIRTFDVGTQRSLQGCEEATILPACESTDGRAVFR